MLTLRLALPVRGAPATQRATAGEERHACRARSAAGQGGALFGAPRAAPAPSSAVGGWQGRAACKQRGEGSTARRRDPSVPAGEVRDRAGACLCPHMFASILMMLHKCWCSDAAWAGARRKV
eukprot:479823-Rhodomonas_salina.2